MVDNLGLSPVVWSEDDSACLDHLGHGDSEGLRGAGLDSEPALREYLRLFPAAHSPLWNDPVLAFLAQHGDALAITVAFNLSAEMELDRMPTPAHAFQNGDSPLYLLLRGNPANHHERAL